MSTSPEDQAARPVCRHCQHHYITHDPAFPYGCRALGFKSRIEPAREVRASSGVDCQYFQLKAAGFGRILGPVDESDDDHERRNAR